MLPTLTHGKGAGDQLAGSQAERGGAGGGGQRGHKIVYTGGCMYPAF